MNVVSAGPSLDVEDFREIRRAMELHHQKWDVQVGDVEALAPFPLVLGFTEWRALAHDAERLYAEVLGVEGELAGRPELHRRLGLPRALRAALVAGRPTPAAARVMRFDFHFTRDGWRISEANTDVPGGFTEASRFAAMMARRFPGTRPAGDPTRCLVRALARSANGHAVALTCAPGFIEDQQVVSHLAAELAAMGVPAHVVSLEQISWHDRYAHIGPVRLGAVFRFFLVEWLARLPDRLGWRNFFTEGLTPICNPGVTALSESKRVPLVWRALSTPVPTWSRLLPPTEALAHAPWERDGGWLIKAAFGNTGETVAIREAMSRGAWTRRAWTARLAPTAWVAQRRFEVLPVVVDDVPHLPCIGVYVIDGEVAGAYGRLSRGLVTDYSARDAAILIRDPA